MTICFLNSQLTRTSKLATANIHLLSLAGPPKRCQRAGCQKKKGAFYFTPKSESKLPTELQIWLKFFSLNSRKMANHFFCGLFSSERSLGQWCPAFSQWRKAMTPKIALWFKKNESNFFVCSQGSEFLVNHSYFCLRTDKGHLLSKVLCTIIGPSNL